MKIRGNPDTIGGIVAALTRAIGWTLRIRIEDRARLLDPAFKEPLIWTFWHNRMFVVPLLRLRAPHRTGAVLTSASWDGEIITAVMKRFGLKAVRGSSSRRGATALMQLAGTLEAGEDVAVTPDGPRGPCYKLGPGVVFLARHTGAGIVPIHVAYSRAIRLATWDRFMIPLPFSAVRIVCDAPVNVPAESDVDEMRDRVERLMMPNEGTDSDHNA
jgi:lysophospholipid acyltransferase (LPLAT)-like uncharacterized protein